MITAQDQQQWGYLLDPCFQIVNTAGKPVTNGYLEVYIAGSRVKYYCASDFIGTLHPFQIPLDSLGSNIVLADPANSYDVYVYNAFGTLLMSRYNVKVSAASGGSSGGLPAQYEAEHWLGQYGATQVLEGNERGQTLALPHRPDYQGDFIDHINWGYINGDEVNQYPKYMYLKPGLYLVNCVIRFQQQTGTEVNRLDELLVYTGNGNANEDVAWQLDETGPYTNTDRHCLKLTFIRKVLDEGESSTVDCNNILYFAPAPQVNWSDAYIQTLQIVKLDSKGGAGTQTYIPGDYVSIIGNVISVTGVLPESATGDFVQYEEFNTEIQNIHNEIDNLEITVQNATAQIVEQTTEIVTSVIEEVAPPMVTSIIERELAGVTGEFATRDELESATANLQDQIDNIEPGVQSDWTEDDPDDPSYIKNKPEEEEVEFEEVDLSVYATKNELQSATSEIINVIETVTGNVPTGAVTHEELENATSVLQNEIENATAQIPSDVVTHPELESATANLQAEIETVSSNIPELPEEEEVEFEELDLSDYATKDEVDAIESELATATANLQTEIETVTGDVIDTVTALIPSDVVTHAELEAATANIPAQVQSDWTETDSSEPSYIQNKPDEEEVEFEELDLSDYATVSNVTALESELETVTADVLQQATGAIPAQVQSDWTESDSADPAFIKHKPSEKILVEGQNVHITASGDYVIISADGGQVTGDYIERDELENVTSQIESEIENVTAQIPSDIVTHSELEAATGDIQADIETVSSMITPELPVVGGNGIGITETSTEITIAVTGDYVASAELASVTADVLDQATANIPAQVQSDWTQTVTGDPSYIKHKPDTLPLVAGDNVTIDEVNGEIVISAQGGGSVTGDYVETSELEAATAEIQSEIESVTASIPTGCVTEEELENVTASIPELPDEEEVDFEEVDLSDYAPATAITAVEADIQTVSSAIPDTSDMATKTWVGNQGYLTSVPATYVTESELATATAAVEADIPVVTGFATKSELNGKQSTLTGITDVQVVQSLPASPVATVLYLIPEA